MAWNMQDYPDSLKNFDALKRKKMIDIANALLDGGYSEDRAIPIAISQGKEWYESASEEELKAFDEEKNPSKNDSHDTSDTNPDLLDEDVVVSYDDDKEEWSVKSVKAERAAGTYKYKTDALERAEEIANNKSSSVIAYTKDGKKE
ncbi:hypothetical protein JEOAER750_01297 [Jeotgalicoccus aerolatus]|mgnify:FL=1|uniref:Uncharacterized protein YdaT n=1 Tax=Jeotgalicoccus aerolatus TaxID=709510 RepID=A0A1G9E0K9_9STAP|nr:DUF2188 domain-containing protein [Jeotgalicoccus aerolatus]MBP1951642.1 uncharacterized protein YdaT [Jeotgalicoccus aerolatus]GGD95936.1 hypothetical protein GCM10007273_05330 [Jeotgalicoccus aerolatus]CAD2075811.1 hypothetical protein JEOAER750_01297 [Jeotgalicoccus aerolatus]SDK69570.1 Uncharacterized protein YdaT [Jeotgalicoccus aerolatus]